MKKLIYSFGIILLFASCTENIDFDLNTDKARLVVEGQISSGKAKHFIKLTQSTSYFFNEETPLVTNAMVSLSDGTNSWTMTEEKPGYYYTPEITPESNKTYSLSINADGENYKATEFMENPIKGDTVSIVLSDTYDTDSNKLVPAYSLFLFVREPEGLGDNYLWKYWLKRPDSAWKNMTPTFSDWIYRNDDFVDGNSPVKGWELFSDIPLEEMPPGTQVRLETYKISTAYYTFLDAVSKQTNRSGFFDGPPANIPSNIDNGALGYFSISGLDMLSTVVN